MLYVYGIIDGSEIRTTIPCGHHRSSVAALPVGGLAAAVSDVAQLDMAPTAENVCRHDQVLDALMEGHAVLPMRFGTTAHRRRLTTALEIRQLALRRALRRVSGMVEIAVRVLTNLPAVAAPIRRHPYEGDDDRSSGMAYLRSRMTDRRQSAPLCERREAAAVSILRRLEALSEEAVWEREGEAQLLFKASFLIAKEGLREFVDTAEALASCHGDVTVRCTGPWAPYSFVTGTGNVTGIGNGAQA